MMEHCEYEWGCDECQMNCPLNSDEDYLDPQTYGYWQVIKYQLRILIKKLI